MSKKRRSYIAVIKENLTIAQLSSQYEIYATQYFEDSQAQKLIEQTYYTLVICYKRLHDLPQAIRAISDARCYTTFQILVSYNKNASYRYKSQLNFQHLKPLLTQLILTTS